MSVDRDLFEQEPPETSARVDVRLVGAETGGAGAVREYVRAVHTGAPWDVILVDGLDAPFISRMDCLRECPGALTPAGCVLLDDAWREAYSDAPGIMDGIGYERFWGLGPARWGMTRTDLYRRSK